MINPDIEIDRFRWKLSDKGWTSEEVDEICDLLSSEINIFILDVTSNAVAEAISFAESIGAEEFIGDIDIVEYGPIFLVKTKSGKTDYSVDRKEMLPHLLKNADVASYGSRYKVIPIRDKEKPKVAMDTMSVMKDMQRAQEAARITLKENNQNNRSARATLMADQFRQGMKQSLTSRGKKTDKEKAGPVTFRTASSKQDPKVDWVIPEKDRDMTQFLYDLNARIEDTIESAVVIILQGYEQEYS